MTKLIYAFRASRSYDDARKLVNYAGKHPLAWATLTPADLSTLDEAQRLVRHTRAA